MQQIILVVTAIVLGLATGYLTGGFAFSSAVCLVAGIFLVTPSLFNFNVSDMRLVTQKKGAIGANLWINYLLMPAAALVIGLASGDLGIAGALMLLALLPGGGMVMMWIKTSGANPKLGFILFMLNLALLLPVTLIFAQYYPLMSGYFPAPDLGAAEGLSTGREVRPFGPFVILIVIPFILSRIARAWLPGLVAFKEKHMPTISKATMFGIVFYLFSLTTSQLLFEVPIEALLRAILATGAFYAVAFTAARFLTANDAEGRAVFWHIATRYITLALILAVFVIDTYGPTFILPVMVAYFIQIGSAGMLRTRMQARAAAVA
ncbi:hypothetical protein [Aliiroseovarius sp.]|uniref:hypothetical protein n=1 Tax=Aliiroseovarius sp. TaxID=1872442 RepID=UPI003BA84871